jgi:hypothetical protein
VPPPQGTWGLEETLAGPWSSEGNRRRSVLAEPLLLRTLGACNGGRQ